jgi:predicted restriction endonuclease
MVFSQHLHGSNDAAGKMLAYHGANLILPQSQEYLPQPEFLEWHRSEVFKNPARP